jgi:hypothetical protein
MVAKKQKKTQEITFSHQDIIYGCKKTKKNSGNYI